MGEVLAALEAERTKGSAAAAICASVVELLEKRLGPAWHALAVKHEGLWIGDHPTLGGVLALVDDAPEDTNKEIGT